MNDEHIAVLRVVIVAIRDAVARGEHVAFEPEAAEHIAQILEGIIELAPHAEEFIAFRKRMEGQTA